MSLRDSPVIQGILARRSLRRFDPHSPVGNSEIELLIECAAAAPCSTGRGPWHFIVVSDRTTLDKMGTDLRYAAMLLQAPLAVVICADTSGKSEAAELFWPQDCAAAMENLLVAAQAIGLGAVWIGVHPIAEREDFLRSLLDIPQEIHTFGVAAIGTPIELKDPHSGIDPTTLHMNTW